MGIQKISSIEMAATKMKHILVLFVILAPTKNLERQFASAKSVRNVVEEESPSISRFLEADLENKKANLQVEDRGCSKNGGGCFFSTAKCCTGVVLPLFVLETKIMQARNIETWQETSYEDQWMMDWKKPEGSGPKKTIKTITKNFSFIFIFNFETIQ